LIEGSFRTHFTEKRLKLWPKENKKIYQLRKTAVQISVTVEWLAFGRSWDWLHRLMTLRYIQLETIVVSTVSKERGFLPHAQPITKALLLPGWPRQSPWEKFWQQITLRLFQIYFLLFCLLPSFYNIYIENCFSKYRNGIRSKMSLSLCTTAKYFLYYRYSVFTGYLIPVLKQQKFTVDYESRYIFSSYRVGYRSFMVVLSFF
jgi:hypothetical protein